MKAWRVEKDITFYTQNENINPVGNLQWREINSMFWRRKLKWLGTLTSHTNKFSQIKMIFILGKYFEVFVWWSIEWIGKCAQDLHFTAMMTQNLLAQYLFFLNVCIVTFIRNVSCWANSDRITNNMSKKVLYDNLI